MELVVPRQYIPHGEKTTLLVNAVCDNLSPLSVLDVGCGPCSSIKEFRRNLIPRVFGIDGDLTLRDNEDVKPFLDNIYFINLEEASFIIGTKFDVVWSYEVAEHIWNVDNYVETLTENCRKYIVMTAAPPYQAGIHHVNLQEKKYWIDRIVDRGFRYRADITDLLKPNPVYERSYFNTNGMVFERI